MFRDCEECNGHGILMAREGWVRCDKCGGTGVRRSDHAAYAMATAAVVVQAMTKEPAKAPPPGVVVVENVMPVDYAERAKARAELDAWMREGVKALHAPQPKVQR